VKMILAQGISGKSQIYRQVGFSCPPGWQLPAVNQQFGMYGPPRCCKRKVAMKGWSAQMCSPHIVPKGEEAADHIY
jgi:hypothetical protein